MGLMNEWIKYHTYIHITYMSNIWWYDMHVGATIVAPVLHVVWRREWKDVVMIHPLLSPPMKVHTHILAPLPHVLPPSPVVSPLLHYPIIFSCHRPGLIKRLTINYNGSNPIFGIWCHHHWVLAIPVLLILGHFIPLLRRQETMVFFKTCCLLRC